MSDMYLEFYSIETPVTYADFVEQLSYLGDDVQSSEREVNGEPVYVLSGLSDIPE